MILNEKKVGFCFTGSFCTLDKIIPEIKKIKEAGADIFPIFSSSVSRLDTRFTTAKAFRDKIVTITGKHIIDSIVEAEQFGPRLKLDLVIIAPCTGNTLAKLINGIIDTPVLMAAKAHLRNNRPLVISISTNDGLGNNARNIGIAVNTKNIYMVPFFQDDPVNKPNSIVANIDAIVPTVINALEKKQIQPIIIERNSL